mmetsp:Transcript_20282/g.42497  ORF Transcript_20282/g.42497 Transcript_20282/m.42497 type:complete len:103 (+) Transcript_20282:190-498(+)
MGCNSLVIKFVTFSLVAWLFGNPNRAICFLSACVSLFDKLIAPTAARRVPEYIFVVLALFGGGTGLFLSFILFNHKIRKTLLLNQVVLATVVRYFLLDVLPI